MVHICGRVSIRLAVQFNHKQIFYKDWHFFGQPFEKSVDILIKGNLVADSVYLPAD
jgi:hypothetical protein